MNDNYFKRFLNCVNCGGVLQNGVCPYCGTDYNSAKELRVKYNESCYKATISIDGKIYKAYLANQEWHPLRTDTYRDEYGKIHPTEQTIKRVWKFIEI